MAWSRSSELKYQDLSLILADPPVVTGCTAGEFDPPAAKCLNAVPQSPTGRVGSSTWGQRIIISGNIVISAQNLQLSPDSWGLIHLSVVWDKQTNGAQLNSEDVYVNPSISTFLSANPLLNTNGLTRYEILRTKIIQVTDPNMVINAQNDLVASAGYTIPFYMDIPLPDVRTIYSDSGATVTSIIDNSFHLLAFASQGNGKILNYNCRYFYYSDI